MPEMSGMEALGRARAAGNKTFAVLMSGKATEERLELGMSIACLRISREAVYGLGRHVDPQGLPAGHGSDRDADRR